MSRRLVSCPDLLVGDTHQHSGQVRPADRIDNRFDRTSASTIRTTTCKRTALLDSSHCSMTGIEPITEFVVPTPPPKQPYLTSPPTTHPKLPCLRSAESSPRRWTHESLGRRSPSILRRRVRETPTYAPSTRPNGVGTTMTLPSPPHPHITPLHSKRSKPSGSTGFLPQHPEMRHHEPHHRPYAIEPHHPQMISSMSPTI